MWARVMHIKETTYMVAVAASNTKPSRQQCTSHAFSVRISIHYKHPYDLVHVRTLYICENEENRQYSKTDATKQRQ